MYETNSARTDAAPRPALFPTLASVLALALCAVVPTSARAYEGQLYQSQSVIRKISDLSEKLELTTNTSRILTLDKNIPRVQVNNPELLAVTPLSANQVQISAKKAGVTQVNLWDEDGNIHTVDVLVYGDVRELEVALATQFPHSTIDVYRYSESLVLKGFVDRPDHVSQIVQLAEDYAPKVINNISVGGVQQVLLKVKVMEVSRTKLRRLGVDFAQLSSTGGVAASSVSGLISAVSTNVGSVQSLATAGTQGGQTFQFGIIDGGQAFFGFLDALQQNRIGKILAEPNLVAVSGRPAQFNVGGEIPIVVPQSLGTASIEFKKFGTQVDFLPIVLGNGNIRLEVRPRISEIDDSRSVVIQSFTIPALTVREVDTAVEMKAGQTFALAGLVQERSEAVSRGLPIVADIPILGVPFRKVEDEVNEIELLILVTPEFVDPVDACEMPCGGPGYATTSPTDCGLYCGGHIEVPAHCNPISGLQSCGNCYDNCGCQSGACGCQNGNCGCQNGGCEGSVITDGLSMPGGVGYDDESRDITPVRPAAGISPGEGASTQTSEPPADRQASRPGGFSRTTVPRPYSPPRQPAYARNASNRNNAQPQPAAAAGQAGGLFGPVGYDVQ